MSICWSQNRTHKAVARKERALRVNPSHDSWGVWGHLTNNHLGVVCTLDIHASNIARGTGLGTFVIRQHHIILGRTFR